MNIDEQKKMFEDMIEGRPLPARFYLQFGFKALFDPFRMLLQYMPGGMGYLLRRSYYGRRLRHMGKNVLIDQGVVIKGPEKISIGDYTWIDINAKLLGVLGEISIGKRVHVAQECMLAGGEKLEIHDYAGLSPGAKIFTNSEAPKDGKRMSGPMIPARFKAFKRGKVIIGKDAFIGTHSVVLPGVTVGEGAVVGANSVVHRDVPDWTVVAGTPARIIGKRDKVTVPEL